MGDRNKELESRTGRVSSAVKRRVTVASAEEISHSSTTTKEESDELYSDISLSHSPTRAPSGWSLSLSLSRAKRALDEEDETRKKKLCAEPKQQEQAKQDKSKSSKRLTLEDLQLLPTVKFVQQTKPALTRPPSRQDTPHSPWSSSASELEEGEVPPSPTNRSSKLAPSFVNDDEVEELKLKVVVLEQQVASLRKTNKSLVERLSDSKELLFKAEIKKLNKNVKNSQKRTLISENEQEQLKAALRIENKKVADLEIKIENVESRLERANEKITDLVNEKKRLHDEVANYKVKIANQRANLTGLENQLIKFKSIEKVSASSGYYERELLEKISPKKCLQVQHCQCQDMVFGLVSEVSTLRARIKNQTNQLANLNAAFDKTRLEASRVETLELEIKTLKLELKTLKLESKRKSLFSTSVEQSWKGTSKSISISDLKSEAAEVTEKPRIWKPPVIVSKLPENSLQQNDSMGAHLFEKKVFKIISNSFIMAKSIMQNFEETAYSLPALRPAFRAAIAAMPPATRTLCMGEVLALLPSPYDLLKTSSAKWYDDPDMQGNDPARMALFWGYQTARHLAGGPAPAAAPGTGALPSLSMWSSPLATTVKREEPLTKDENANVIGVRRGAAPVPARVADSPAPPKVQQATGEVEQSAPAPAPAEAMAGAGGALPVEGQQGQQQEVPVEEQPGQQQEVPVEEQPGQQQEGPVDSVATQQRANSPAPAPVEAGQSGGSYSGPDFPAVPEPPTCASGDVLPTGQGQPCTAEADAAVTAFLHSMYQSTLPMAFGAMPPAQWSYQYPPGCAGASCPTASPALARPATVAYPLYLYEGMKYQSTSVSQCTGFCTPSMVPELPQYGCQLPPHLAQRKSTEQPSNLEPLPDNRPDRISFSIQELKKRITTHLKPSSLDVDT